MDLELNHSYLVYEIVIEDFIRRTSIEYLLGIDWYVILILHFILFIISRLILNTANGESIVS